MCGILLHVGPAASGSDEQEVPEWWEAAARVVDARGPDALGTKVVETAEDGSLTVAIHASVLALRGTDIVSQPMASSDGKLYFLWNGEVFETTEVDFDFARNDGLQLFEIIQDRISATQSSKGRVFAVKEAFNEALSSIDGPFAAVLIDLSSGLVMFGRDPLGRRSLLLVDHGESIILLSAANGDVVAAERLSEVSCEALWAFENGALRAVQRQQTELTARVVLQEFSEEKRELSVSAGFDETFLDILSESVRRRVQYARPVHTDTCANVAILFSGGIDCTALAIMAHRHLPHDEPIDLINVAFENPRSLRGQDHQNGEQRRESDKEPNRDVQKMYDVPDRKTGRASLAELQRIAPERHWRFIAVNVSFAEYTGKRPDIEALLAPNASLMDLSIGAALYFASQGQGIVEDGDAKPYRSQARVLLSGLGADELLGGYSRHRRAFERSITSDGQAHPSSERALIAELQMDLDRLPQRNLGRDDRVLSASGREARYPFLARSVLDFLAALPVAEKMDLSAPPGKGDKSLLRRIAAQHLGLTQTSALTKRAIQFGARSAKMDIGTGRTKGSESFRLA